MQVLQVRVQIALVITPHHPIHTGGAFRVEAPIRAFQQGHIQKMGQRGELHLRILTCLCCDPLQTLQNRLWVRSPLIEFCLEW
jgi:hypothetical protein